ncbi:MAG: AbrB/MazE/SpoVT family DNA-binding domain-containing protein [Candidatus Eremiobacterota bacterium]
MRSGELVKTARLFMNGGSQAVRLPAEFRFEGDSVYVRRDPRTGDVILSARPGRSWAEFMELRSELGAVVPGSFAARELAVEERDPFEGWVE